MPDDTEAVSLALQWAKKLGIDRSEFALKGRGSELQTYRSQKTKEGFRKKPDDSPPEVICRGISLVRQLDGLPFTGRGEDGGLSIDFGDQGKVAKLQLVWRKLECYKLLRGLSPSEIMEGIRNGKARTSPFTPVSSSPAKQLTIKRVVCAYLGASGDSFQKFVYPFAGLECILDDEAPNRVEIILNCPILAEAR